MKPYFLLVAVLVAGALGWYIFNVFIPSPGPLCDAQWECSDWSVCSSGEQVRSCPDWSSCLGGNQTRTCSDKNACGTAANRPPQTQSCTAEGCTENWFCGNWR